MSRIDRIGAGRASSGHSRIVLGCVYTALAAAVLLITAAVAFGAIAKSVGRGAAVQADSRCNYRVYQPDVHYGIFAKAQFDCTSSHQNSTATVVMQHLSNGHWNTLASKFDHLDIQAGKTYKLQTKKWQTTEHCSGQPRVGKLRTHFSLRLNGKLFIAYTTPVERVKTNYLPCK